MRLQMGVLHFLPMKLVTGRVENGKVALPEGEFEEGAAVAVLSTADEAGRPDIRRRRSTARIAICGSFRQLHQR